MTKRYGVGESMQVGKTGHAWGWGVLLLKEDVISTLTCSPTGPIN